MTRKPPAKPHKRPAPAAHAHKGAPRRPASPKPPAPAPAPARHKPLQHSHSKGMRPDSVLLFGIHAVREALRSRRRTIRHLWATPATAERLAADIAAKNITPDIVALDAISARLPPDSVHQGILAEVAPLPPFEIEDLPATGLVLILDQVTDPHNLGAIIRTAAAFNVDAIVTTERHSPALTGIVAKTASGALEHVPIITIVNLARALEDIADRGYVCVGLDSEGPRALSDIPLARPLALVLGAEGKGLRRLTREKCDHLARIDMPGPIKSLNVSNACAVALTIVHLALSHTLDR